VTAVVELSRRQVLAHRVAVHGLVNRVAALPSVALLDLGVQDTPPGSLRVALSARLAEPLIPEDDGTADGALTLVWSHRGAPHLHRTAQLPALAAGCWPRDDADAGARLGWQRARLAAAGVGARAAYREVAEAVRAVLDRPLSKAALSSGVTARIRPELAPFCRPCGGSHVADQLLRLAGLPAGARLRPSGSSGSPLVLEPIPGWAGPPADEQAGTAALQEAYLRFFAPASDADVAGFLGTSAAAVRPDRPAGLVRVRVDGGAGAVPIAQLDALRRAEHADVADVVRLLPPSDPLLQGRDREVLLPDAAQRKALWRPLGSPGAVVSGVEVVATWRARQPGRRLDVLVDGFRPLSPPERAAVEREAQRLAAVRGSADVRVRYPDLPP
jgi:hypothetical protein